ncbi:hypothetical protein [Branchiibius cervicis]|uniref:Uncharacterized protein n=1 Tax=Branchiibius cervicis TaxID=908252 RepID=A0ABW2AVD7_9MICO
MIRRKPNPITVLYTDPETGYGPPWLVSVPAPLRRQDLNDAPGKGEGAGEPAAVLKWLRTTHHAYDVGRSELRMTWCNRGSEQMVVDSATARVLSRSERQHETLFDSSNGGPEPRFEFGFDLDDPRPTPVRINADGMLERGQPRFGHEIVKLPPGDQVAVGAVGRITKGDCEWEIELRLVIGKGKSTQRIGGAHGQPIRTAAEHVDGRYPFEWVTGLALECEDAQVPPYLHDRHLDEAPEPLTED